MQRVDFLKLKCKLRVGCWNVRTLYQEDKFAQASTERNGKLHYQPFGCKGSKMDWYRKTKTNFRARNIAFQKAGQ